MYYVYVLRLRDSRLYVGYTEDLKERIVQHQNGMSEYTSKFLPVKLIYYECYGNSTDARTREIFLKTGRGREVLRKQLKETLK